MFRLNLLALLLLGSVLAERAWSQACGKQTAPLQSETKIVGGQLAQEGEWPWQALILNGDSGYGGILIDAQWVLTWPAEHDSTITYVQMGSNNMGTPSSNLQTRTVKDRFVHPDYTGEFDYQVALLKLSSPFDITNYVRTVCVPSEQMDFNAGTKCTAAGWGARSESDPYLSDLLYEVDVDVVSRSSCQNSYDNQVPVTDSMVCAGGVGGKGICHGDGPLVSQVNSSWYVVGVPSWGYGCARAGYPAVYTYVPGIYEWIEPIFRGEDPPRLQPTPSPPPPSQGCGVQTAQLNPEINIVGGQPAQEGEWPWQALILNGESGYGGILVSPQWVLTWPADHTSAETNVLMGTNNFDSPTSNLQTRSVTKRFIHPNWDREFKYNVALLKLSIPFSITNYVRTICVPPTDMSFSTGRSCIAAGWGATSEYDPNLNNRLYEVEVNVVSRSSCQNSYDNQVPVTSSMICAGGVGGKGICHGDGPLVTKSGSKWYVVGVPSWGYGCARAGYPAVYTYAPAIYEWMEPIFRGQDPGSGSGSSTRSYMWVMLTSFMVFTLCVMK